MSQRRIELWLEWLEAHPETYDAVRKKIGQLAIANQQATNLALKGAKTKQQEVNVLSSATESYQDEATTIARQNIPGYKAYEDITERARKKQAQMSESIKNLGLKFQQAGWRVGFFGWIVSYSARSVFRIFSQLYRTFTNMIKTAADWPTSLTKVAYALAMLESRGLLTADMQTFLESTMEDLINLGPDFQALWAGLEATMIGIAVKISKNIIPAILKGLDKLAAFITENEKVIAELAERFVGEFLPALIECLPAILNIAMALMPLIPIVAQLLKLFGPLIPVIFLLGTVLWTIGPIFTLLGSIISMFSVGPLAGLLSALIPLLPVIISLVAAVGSAVGVFLLLKDRIGPIPALIAAVVTGILVGVAAFKILTLVLGAMSPVLAGAGAAIGAFGAAATPAIPILLTLGAAVLMAGAGFALAGAGVWLAVNAIIQLANSLGILGPLVPVLAGVAVALIGIAAAGLGLFPAVVGIGAMAFAMGGLALAIIGLTAALWGLVAAAKAFEEVGGFVSNVVGGITSGIGNLGNALMSLCFRHAMPTAKKFGEVVSDVTDKTVGLDKEVRSLGSGLRGLPTGEVGVAGGRGAGAGTQHVTVYAPLSIGTVAAQVDIDKMKEEVNKSIADGVRRRK